MPQQETRDIEKIASGLRPLLKAESESRFAIGDYLIENNHLRPSEMKRLAELVNREKSTLETYLKVSTVFPPSRRRLDLAWGVFKQLARVEDERWQDDYLAESAHATTSATERAVNAKLLADRRGPDGRVNKGRYSDRAWVPGVEASLTVFGEHLTVGEVVLDGLIEKAELVYSEVHGQWRVNFTLAEADDNR
jgi:hypothetical protein